jgi:hypothetical protein
MCSAAFDQGDPVELVPREAMLLMRDWTWDGAPSPAG